MAAMRRTILSISLRQRQYWGRSRFSLPPSPLSTATFLTYASVLFSEGGAHRPMMFLTLYALRSLFSRWLY
ncbi:MAG: hypothetical protein IKB31_02585, partial [Bacteroidaceae bacterium]|nr:hypothetical protein [Bacteroidaceae bacterium]